jgi:hypothetical protein
MIACMQRRTVRDIDIVPTKYLTFNFGNLKTRDLASHGYLLLYCDDRHLHRPSILDGRLTVC